MQSLGEPKLLLDGLEFAEGPRWHDGRLWLADMIGHKVIAVDLSGTPEVIAEFDDEPSGLGFLPDGTPIVVLRAYKHLVALGGSSPSLYADLSSVECESLNDMVIDGQGRAYVDAVVRRAEPGTDDVGEGIVYVDAHGQIVDVTLGLINPNGLAISADGRELVVAETWLNRLTTFPISDSGRLIDDRMVFADLDDATPDGICLDADGAAWVGCAAAAKFVRVARGGEILAEIDTGGSWAVACAFGGNSRTTLFLLSADTSRETLRKPGGTKSRIEILELDVPGVGWP